jgi:RNA polymerase-binding transcription factor DksA
MDESVYEIAALRTEDQLKFLIEQSKLKELIPTHWDEVNCIECETEIPIKRRNSDVSGRFRCVSCQEDVEKIRAHNKKLHYAQIPRY